MCDCWIPDKETIKTYPARFTPASRNVEIFQLRNVKYSNIVRIPDK